MTPEVIEFERPQIDELLVVLSPVNLIKVAKIQGQVSNLLDDEASPWRGKYRFAFTEMTGDSDIAVVDPEKFAPNQLVISCGGDGLMNIVANGLIKAWPK